MNRDTSPPARPTSGRVEIAVICEDMPTHERAQRICNELTDDLAPDFQCETRWWRIDQLQDVFARQDATEAAASADMVVISVHTGGAFSRLFDEWVDEWVSHRKPGPAALVGLVGTAEGDHQRVTPRHDLLRRVAARAGMDYLPEGIWERTRQRLPESAALKERRDALSPVLSGILAASHPDIREWGINE